MSFIHRKYSTKGIPRLSSMDRTLVTIPDNVRDILVGNLLGVSFLSLSLIILIE